MNRYLAPAALTSLLALSLATTLPARADVTVSADGAPSQTLQISRGELSTRGGIVRVHRELEAAANDVCRSWDSRQLALHSVFRRCVADSLSRAVQDVHDATLTAYHQRKTGAERTATVVAGSPLARR